MNVCCVVFGSKDETFVVGLGVGLLASTPLLCYFVVELEKLVLQGILWVYEIAHSFEILIFHQVEIVPNSILVSQIILCLDSLEDLWHGISIIALGEVVGGDHESESIDNFSGYIALL